MWPPGPLVGLEKLMDGEARAESPVDKRADSGHIHAHDQTGDIPPTEALAAF
jgi:hypothetical protein